METDRAGLGLLAGLGWASRAKPWGQPIYPLDIFLRKNRVVNKVDKNPNRNKCGERNLQTELKISTNVLKPKEK